MAESRPGPGPDTVHSLLGLPETASSTEIRGGYWRLRGHIEERLQNGSDPALEEARRAELDHLQAEYLSATGADSSEMAPSPRPRTLSRGRIAWTAAIVSVVAVMSTAAVVQTGLLWRGAPNSSMIAPPTPLAILIIEADPATAQLTVTSGEDGRVEYSGPADGSPVALAPGAYDLEVAHPDCPDRWHLSTTLEAGNQRSYEPRICRGKGRLVVRSNVSDDRVRIDGVDVGSTRTEAHSIRVGAHQVRVEKQGFEPWVGEVRIEPDAEITLQAELQANSGRPAKPPPSEPAPQTVPRQKAARIAASTTEDQAGGMLNRTTGTRPIPKRTGRGGSKSWHDAVKQDLVSQFDRNGSGSLDTTGEIEAIPCETWRNIEQSYETGGLAVEMTHLYGFDGSEAPANTLGVTSSVRGYAYERMKDCGLKSRR